MLAAMLADLDVTASSRALTLFGLVVAAAFRLGRSSRPGEGQGG